MSDRPLYLVRQPLPQHMEATFGPAASAGALEHLHLDAGVRGGEHLYNIISARERIEPRDWRWHISVCGRHHVPPWEDMVEVAHKLRPGVVFVLGIPPRSWWINIADHALHLWELKDDALVGQWHAERAGMVPS